MVRVPRTETRYDVIDEKSNLELRVAMKVGVDIIGFGRGPIFALATDEDGLQSIQRYAMPRGPK